MSLRMTDDIVSVSITLIQTLYGDGRRGDGRLIQLNYRDVRPFYEQIKDEIRRLVIAGAVEADEKLPSVRELAARLAINPNTIQRAYHDLEQEGYIYRVRGKGTYAAPQAQVQDERVRMLQEQYEQVVTELLYLNIPKEVLRQWMDELGQEVRHDTGQSCGEVI